MRWVCVSPRMKGTAAGTWQNAPEHSFHGKSNAITLGPAFRKAPSEVQFGKVFNTSLVAYVHYASCRGACLLAHAKARNPQ